MYQQESLLPNTLTDAPDFELDWLNQMKTHTKHLDKNLGGVVPQSKCLQLSKQLAPMTSWIVSTNKSM